jgi:transcriptional regulator with XRE-family HTH domain
MSLKETEKRLMSKKSTQTKIKSAQHELELSVALHELRAGRVTQAELAEVLGVSQRRVSAIEHSHDVQISTLRAYLDMLGYELELVARDAHGERITLQLGG